MDIQQAQPPVGTVELLNIFPAQQRVNRRSLTPVTLERCWVRMDGQITPSTSAESKNNIAKEKPSNKNGHGTSAEQTDRPTASSPRLTSSHRTPRTSSTSTQSGVILTPMAGAPSMHLPSTSQQTQSGKGNGGVVKTSVEAPCQSQLHQQQYLVGGQQSQRGFGAHSTEDNGRLTLDPHGLCTTMAGTTSSLSATRNQTNQELEKKNADQTSKDGTSTLSTSDHNASHEMSRTTKQSDRGRAQVKKNMGKLGVQFSDESQSSPRASPRDVGDVMQFFAEQEKNLQENFLALPKRGAKKQRSPSPKVSPAAGLEHLDNLVRLMEQLGSLKDENSRLRQRCHYLESTKVLLQARKDLAAFEGGGTPSRHKTTSSRQLKQRHPYHYHRHHSKRAAYHLGDLKVPGSAEILAASYLSHPSQRGRLSSAEEFDLPEISDSYSDQRPKRPKAGLQTRSFSTGSLEVPSDFLEKVSGVDTRKSGKIKFGRSTKSGGKSKSKSSSKWARVKRVFTGQKLYEDLGSTIRTIRELGRSATSSGGNTYGRFSTSGPSSSSPLELSPLSSRVSASERRPTDSGIGLANTSADSATGGVPQRPPIVVVPLIPRSEIMSRYEQETSDSDLTFDIWMGPPDWWEEYEARGDEVDPEEGSMSGPFASNSDIGSVIEVTQMYLGGHKKDTLAAPSSPTTTSSSALTSSLTASSISSTSIPTPIAPLSPSTTSPSLTPIAGASNFLNVERASLHRRQSSPSLNGREASEERDDILDELASLTESPTRLLHKSSSCQSADLDIPSSGDFHIEGRKSKSHRTAWGRVKDIIHTRKDSGKRRPKKQRSEPKTGIESEEASEIDLDGLNFEEQWCSGSFGESLLSRSTPKSSPSVSRQQTQYQPSSGTSAPQGIRSPSTSERGASGGLDMAAMLAGRMSDEFSKKMQEWEALKSRKSCSFKVSGDESDLGSLDVSSSDYPLRTIDLKDLKGKVPDGSSDGTTPGDSHTSLEVLGAPTGPSHLEEIQKRMTDSFSRKMQEWEKLKYRSGSTFAPEPSPDMERKGSKGRKEERQKSKRSREDKEKEKLEKMREREKQKVEKEEIKLEKEKIRLEKERLRALEREAKLEKLKDRLSHSEMESGLKNPVLAPLAEYKVTADFAHKLHQWELKKGLSHDVSNSIYLEAQKLNMQHLRHEQALRDQSQKPLLTETKNVGKPEESTPLTLEPYWDLTESSSPSDRNIETSLLDEGDDVEDTLDTEVDADADTATSITEECLTKSHIITLERANQQLIETLQLKEKEYADVQQQVLDVNRKLEKVKDEHAKEMARFHRELALGSITEPVKLEVGELESTMHSMEDKIKAMESLGERLAVSMESAAVGKWQSIDGEETVHRQLVELVDQMRNMLIQASHSEEQSKKSTALTNFEQLYSHAMTLQVQMNNLRLSHLERNREIMTVKRQLLLQEVNNLLLQADITRRETELYQFQAAKKFASLRRWNTFSASDRRPQAQMEVKPKPTVELQPEGTSHRDTAAPHVNIPYISEDVILASAASASLSAPASPSAIEAAGGITIPSTTSQQQQYLAPMSINPAGAQLSPSINASSKRIQHHSKGDEAMEDIVVGATASQIEHMAAPGGPTSLVSNQRKPKAAKSDLKVDSSFKFDSGVSIIETPQQVSLTPIVTEKVNKANESRKDITEHQSRNPSSFATLTPAVGTTTRTELTTISDSAPLYKEIKELRKAKSLVERGSPTLILSKEGRSLSTAPSPGKGFPRPSDDHLIYGTPDKTIPQQQSLQGVYPTTQPFRLTRAAATIDNDNDSLSSITMECKNLPKPSGQVSDQTKSSLSGKSITVGSDSGPKIKLSPRLDTRRELPQTSDASKASIVKCPRSPVTKHNYLRRQKEDRDSCIGASKQHVDYKAISPTGSPLPTRGKPPLPRQNTPLRQTPHTSPMPPEKGPRSKSVGEMSNSNANAGASQTPDVVTHKPLQEAISKFEKRQTMCETEERPLELRKTPSPTLHLPRVGLVSRVRRIKPAAELLEESQRYRSGHTIYTTRIMQRFLPKDDTRGTPHESINDGTSSLCDAAASGPIQNKENTYIHSIVQRLSRENSPVKSVGSSRTNSEISLKRTDSGRSNSEFVSHIVRKLSNGSGSASPKYKNRSPSSPFKDRTNDGQVKKLALSFDDTSENTQQALTNSDVYGTGDNGQSRLSTDGSSNTTLQAQQKLISEGTSTASSLPGTTQLSMNPTALSSSTEHGIPIHSKQTYNLTSSSPEPTDTVSITRGRAATYCPSDQTKRQKERDTHPPRPASVSIDPLEKETKSKANRGRSPASSLSPVRRGGGRGRMGTVGVLCKQSISFDLGVSLYAQKAEEASKGSPKATRQVRSWDPSESAKAEAAAAASSFEITSHSDPGTSGSATASYDGRPISSGSEGDPSSPRGEERNKIRRFFDSNWLQKSKRFFKVSK